MKELKKERCVSMYKPCQLWTFLGMYWIKKTNVFEDKHD